MLGFRPEDRVVILTDTLPEGLVGSSYGRRLRATGPEDVKWSLLAGRLPDGLTLSTDGLLGGTPSEATIERVTVQAKTGRSSDTRTLDLVTRKKSVSQARAVEVKRRLTLLRQTLREVSYPIQLNALLTPDPDGVTRTFSTIDDFYPGTAILFLNGVKQVLTGDQSNPDGYQELSTNQLLANLAPKLGDKIHTGYLRNVPGWSSRFVTNDPRVLEPDLIYHSTRNMNPRASYLFLNGVLLSTGDFTIRSARTAYIRTGAEGDTVDAVYEAES